MVFQYVLSHIISGRVARSSYKSPRRGQLKAYACMPETPMCFLLLLILISILSLLQIVTMSKQCLWTWSVEPEGTSGNPQCDICSSFKTAILVVWKRFLIKVLTCVLWRLMMYVFPYTHRALWYFLLWVGFLFKWLLVFIWMLTFCLFDLWKSFI